jgi:hypothetical protein
MNPTRSLNSEKYSALGNKYLIPVIRWETQGFPFNRFSKEMIENYRA